MKRHAIGILALKSPHVSVLDVLELEGFDLSKKVFEMKNPLGSVYFQAESKTENRALRLEFPGECHFHLAKKKAVVGGGYR